MKTRKRLPSQILIDDGVARVRLYGGGEALIDAADVGLVDGYRWSLQRIKGRPHYARCVMDGRTTYMHRHITGATRGAVVDHIDHAPLNNRRDKLRVCTYSQNCLNRVGASSNSKSGIRGVSCDSRGYWQAYTKVGALRIARSFKSAEAAAAWITEQRAKLHGEFFSG